ncbi:MAG: hypothetical protein UY07_C0027G0007 [Parcubacteria group bacterium GW2011_GWA1_47_8]|nr:MAG: hypothetical protein UY07_C0027G0007 [Parcubacteria group bacterium GW2011_GWA1_47_8]KKW07040.1 MAG: hypothetical protein UY42_C0019G0006 [Parcubacteria group bacterium GW2011_GWA2_49_16]
MNTLVQQKQLQSLVRRTIIESVQEIFADPDLGLRLSSQTIKQLKKAQKVNPKKLTSLMAFDKKR